MTNTIEIAGANRPLFPDIKPSAFRESRAEILRQFAYGIGEKTPYGSSDLEFVSPIGEDARVVLVNGMLSLPGTEGHDLFVTSKNLHFISDNEATHKALDRMYAGPVAEDPDGYLWSRLFMENIHNAMAVRNRFRVVGLKFINHMIDAFDRQQKGSFHVLSVAAGSSRAIIQPLKDLNKAVENRIVLQMVDNSKQALADGQQLVKELGIKAAVRFTEANFLPTTRYMNQNCHPEFVEVAGLFDYLSDDLILRFLREIKAHMADGGTVLYSNIAPNDEQDFTHKIVGWRPMVYRTKNDLARLSIGAGFKAENIRIIQEPLGIYNLVVATK